MKQKKTQQFCFKLHSSFLEKHNWDLILPIDEARKSAGTVISLADSQILTWINELNGTSDYDEKAKSVQRQIRTLKKQKNHPDVKNKIKQLYKKLYTIQFRPDYLCVIMDKKSHYDRANKGFKVNGVEYKRLITTVGGVKMSTVVYTSKRLLPELKKRIANGRNEDMPIVPAKLGAYEALCSSASVPVSHPKGVIVVHDVEVKFKADMINIDDSDTTQEPLMEFVPNQIVKNNISDGCSMMLPSLAERWGNEIGEEILSGCNLRNSFLKGMSFCFDYVEWFEKNAPSFIIKDVWGHDRDVRQSELIVTESQLKLWASYSSWEDYAENCERNKYTFRLAKTSPHKLDDIRQLNYQFIQPYELDDNSIDELIKPTVDEIRDIMGFDYKKSIVYLCGSGLNENNITSADLTAQALMINRNMIDDPYVYGRIHKMISKRIECAKIGVLDVHGNFQILSGDLVALCESMANIEIKGSLKAGECFSQYWKEQNVSEVVCFRAPMSNASAIIKLRVNADEDIAYWYRYIGTNFVLNGWDCSAQALNGCDFDGDLIFSTNNTILLDNYVFEYPLNCIQHNAKKIKTTEKDIIKSNKQGFGSEIGQITNRITEMTSLMSLYSHDSEEYKILKYRTFVGQNYQQNEIDKAKGIVTTPMPKSWYVHKENRICDDDDAETIKRKKLYQKICASKKPYFFIYNYPSLKKKYDSFYKHYNGIANSQFGCDMDALRIKTSRTESENKFLQIANACSPISTAPSTINKICWAVENIFDNIKICSPEKFNTAMIKSNTVYDKNTYNAIYKEYKWFKEKNAELLSEDREQIQMLFKEKCDSICPDAKKLCDILIDMIYNSRNQHDIVWYVCGDTIIQNLLEHNNMCMYYPEATDDYGDFNCCGQKFVMKKKKIGGGVDGE